jgi:hypothetical protein
LWWARTGWPASSLMPRVLLTDSDRFPAGAVTLPWQKPGGKPVTVSLMFTKDDEGAIWRNDFNRYAWHPALRVAGVAPGR